MSTRVSVDAARLGAFAREAARISHGRLIAVVKSRCYGLGYEALRYICPYAHMLAVQDYEEYKELRALCHDKKMLILAPVYDESNIISVVNSGGVFSVHSLRQGQVIARIASVMERVAEAHLALDTGMSRYGVRVDNKGEIDGCLNLPAIRYSGAYSHLYNGDDADSSLSQMAKFEKAVHGYGFSDTHIQNSGSMARFGLISGNCSRCGIALLDGGSEDVSAIRVSARVQHVKQVSKGESIGYDAAFVAGQDMRVAIIGAGYADGIPQTYSCGRVLIDGQFARLIGKVCMNCCFADVTELSDVCPGSEVLFVGDDGAHSLTLTRLADAAHISRHEAMLRLCRGAEINYCK